MYSSRYQSRLTFSVHALQRMEQRTSFTRAELTAVIEGERYVVSGSVPAMARDKLVVFSPEDDTWFVVVLDRLLRELVTIWPLEYASNLFGEIPQEDLLAAKALMSEWYPEAKEFRKALYAQGFEERYLVKIQYLAGDAVKSLKVGRYSIRELQGDFNNILSCAEFLSDLRQKLAARKVDPSSVTLISGEHPITKAVTVIDSSSL